jgi:hypothetical protein
LLILNFEHRPTPVIIGLTLRTKKETQMKKLLLTVILFASATAYAANSYHVTLYRTTNINGTDLKPGDIKVEILDNKAIVKQGKTTVESAIKLQNGAQKFASTTVGYNGDSAKNEIQEIRLGGTTTTVVFESVTANEANRTR